MQRISVTPLNVYIARYSILGVLLGVAACLALLVQYMVMSIGFVRDTPGGLPHYVLRPDFIVSVTGAELLLHGNGTLLYDEGAQRDAEEGALRDGGVAIDPRRLLGFNHPPFVAILVAGLRLLGLPYSAIFLLWTMLRLAVIGGGLWALSRAWLIRGVSSLLCALLALTFYPVVTSLLVGQTTAFVLLGWAAGSAALRFGRDGAAGAWLALAVLKPQDLPVILLALVVMRRWRALGTFALTVGIATVLAMPFVGWDWPVHFAQLLLKQATQPPNVVIDPAMMQNWRGFFMRVLNFSPNAPLYAAIATVLTILAVAAVWLLAYRKQQAAGSKQIGEPSLIKSAIRLNAVSEAKQNPQSATESRLWAFTLCAALLASYHLLYPDLALAVVPGWIIASIVLAMPVSKPGRWAWLGWLWIGWGLGFVVNYQSLWVAIAPAWLAITAGALLLTDNRRRTVDGGR